MAPVAAAFLPHPPLLVPDLAGTAAPELDPLRAACREALVAVTATADLTILVGTGPVWAVPTPSAVGSFHPYGADLEVTLPALTDLALPAALTDLQRPALTDNDRPGLPAPAQLAELPLSLAVAAHLLATLDPPPAPLAAVTVPAALGPSAAATIGHALAAAGQRAATRHILAAAGRGGGSAVPGPPPGSRGGQAHGSADRGRSAPRIGLVVMGDLSACRTDRAPGGFRPEAAAFDATVSEAFRRATPHRLLDLDPTQAATLLVSGRVPLQVLAGAFGQPDPDGEARGGQGQPGRGGPIARVPRDQGPDTVARETGSDGTLGQARPELGGRVLYEGAPYGVGYLVAVLSAS